MNEQKYLNSKKVRLGTLNQLHFFYLLYYMQHIRNSIVFVLSSSININYTGNA
jgi:hypothetical protein